MAVNNAPVETFDRQRRRLVRNRAIHRTGKTNFLNQIMSDELIERLSLVNREFESCLVIGSAPSDLLSHLNNQGMKVISIGSANALVECDEDRLPFKDSSFDLIMCVGALDTVNDLPGALILTRRILKPDGLFLGAFPGAESLSSLKALIMKAEGDHVAPHIHPQIDVRTLGDLMMRAGFALPVVDNHALKLRYGSFEDLVRDIRDFGGSNVLTGSPNPVSKRVYTSVKSGFEAQADSEGKTTETIELLYLCGWAPHPDQPSPARRGSGQVSLKSALGEKNADKD